MFIVISKKFFIINKADIDSAEKQPGSTVCVLDLSDETKEPVAIEWPPKIVASRDEPKSKPKQPGNPRVICGVVSPSEDLIALCDDQKNLVVFNKDFEALRHFVVNRNIIKLLFRSDEKTIFSCDKTGDVYEFCLSESTSQEKLLFGHCSMMLDFILTPDDRYIISGDRDEKIRVTNYPNTYNVESYCLGHEEFVSTLQLLDSSTLVSGSGDGRVIFWDFLSGKRLFSFDCDQREKSPTNEKPKTEKEQSPFPIKSITTDSANATYMAVTFYKQALIYVFKVLRNSDHCASSLELTQKIETDSEPVLVQFDKAHSNFLWVIGGFTEKPGYLLELKKGEFIQAFNPKVVDFLSRNEQVKVTIKAEQQTHPLEGLYKHNFNNVEKYYERKMLRIENENKK